MKSIDFEVIKKYLNVAEKDLLDKKLSEILEMNSKAKELEIEDLYQNNLPIQDKFFLMFEQYDLFRDLFGKSYVDKNLLRIRLGALTDEYCSSRVNQPPFKRAIHLKNAYRDIVIPPARTRKTRTLCSIWMIPSQFQGLKHEKIIRSILYEKYPWIKEFTVDIYEIRREDSNMYIKSKKDSLYVPLTLFVNGDVDKIKSIKHNAQFENDEIVNKFYRYLEGIK